ncbi:hypothetical protein P7C70_g5888, partial [Phenoliferia sp. Uapishka_3]
MKTLDLWRHLGGENKQARGNVDVLTNNAPSRCCPNLISFYLDDLYHDEPESDSDSDSDDSAPEVDTAAVRKLVLDSLPADRLRRLDLEYDGSPTGAKLGASFLATCTELVYLKLRYVPCWDAEAELRDAEFNFPHLMHLHFSGYQTDDHVLQSLLAAAPNLTHLFIDPSRCLSTIPPFQHSSLTNLAISIDVNHLPSLPTFTSFFPSLLHLEISIPESSISSYSAVPSINFLSSLPPTIRFLTIKSKQPAALSLAIIPILSASPRVVLPQLEYFAAITEFRVEPTSLWDPIVDACNEGGVRMGGTLDELARSTGFQSRKSQRLGEA